MDKKHLIKGECFMKLIGRDKEIAAIEDCMAVHTAGLHPGECPAGIFMLAGPTGTGKTR